MQASQDASDGDCVVIGYTWDGKKLAGSSPVSWTRASRAASTGKSKISSGSTTSDSLSSGSSFVAAAVLSGPSTKAICTALKQVRKTCPQTFTIVHSPQVSRSARGRLDCFRAGARMLAHDDAAVEQGLRTIMRQFDAAASVPNPSGRVYSCPECGLAGLSEDALHLHFPLYHSMENTRAHDCPICDRRASEFRAFAVHLHNEHGPIEEREPAFPAFAAFSWVVCRRPSDGKLLLCHEPAAIAGGKPAYWFPAGRVDEGETFLMAGERETQEEAGIQANVKGVLLFKLEGGLVPRVVLYAEPVEDQTKEQEEGAAGGQRSAAVGTTACIPKSLPDFESCGAVWLDVSELDNLTERDYRGGGTAELYRAVASGELAPLPLDNPSYEALEEMVQRLTKDQDCLMDKWLAEIKRVWALLKEDNPPERLKME
eukprot:CAMPEP_0119488486 /NCGR_PEP_ID=MMETSP1344-20130328/14251_1 /TAXON_ID=236787 /ORGANISM="Florenciella parvula, Strain CCMP2471" /LENGTH=427 /DNA_ID=CAMNT_0007523443 /DNA_START=59 /DNA_END=1342 /DNA_ORIENTATION=+